MLPGTNLSKLLNFKPKKISIVIVNYFNDTLFINKFIRAIFIFFLASDIFNGIYEFL
ncbi:hypothetical protein QE357_004777 [Siphonobacter sp. BAB-5404]|nr:hypothetical protein [Siphonobacter sp. SORGH_AS_0500]